MFPSCTASKVNELLRSDEDDVKVHFFLIQAVVVKNANCFTTKERIAC